LVFGVYLALYSARLAWEALGVFKRVGTLVGEPVESHGRPGPGVLERCRALGEELAAAVSR